MALYLSSDERAITARASLRWQAFLRSELEELPTSHPLHAEYGQQLKDLERRQRRLVAVPS